MAFTFAAVADLVALLRGAGLEADADAALVNAPGAWVQVTGIREPSTLCHARTISTKVWLVAPDTEPDAAMTILAGLYTKALTVVDPDGDTDLAGIVLPHHPGALPALAFPLDLTT